MVLRYLMTRTWMSVVCLFAAGFVAAFDYLALAFLPEGLCEVGRQGANIELACAVVACTAVATLPATLLLATDLVIDPRPRVVAALLLIGAGASAVAVSLILADSATYARTAGVYDYNTSTCSVDQTTVVNHVYGLLAVLGVSLLFALLRAYGAWRGVERHGPRRRSNWTLPAPS